MPLPRLLAALALLPALTAGCRRPSAPAPPPAEAGVVLEHRVVYAAPDVYVAWPSIVRAANGDLLVAFTRTEAHVSPDGAIVLMRSRDEGRSWEGPHVFYDSPIDDRESGFTQLPDGRLLAHLWSTHWTAEAYRTQYAEAYPAALLDAWIDRVEQPAYRRADTLHGGWVSTSTDQGRTWSRPVRGPDSIHGGTVLQDGTLLAASYREHDGHIGVYTAAGAGQPWTLAATVRCPRRDSLRFGEPHVLQLRSGRLLLMIRATAIPYDDRNPYLWLWETYSDDGGRRWAPPFETPLWGFPPHLAQLSDGRVLVTYGYRRRPFGQRAALSDDGITWTPAREVVLRDDAPDGDLGYPASIEIAPDTVLTVYYQKPDAGSKPALMATRWVVPPPSSSPP